MKVALLGLGAMGSQFLLRLAESGADVTAWNRSPARAGLPRDRIVGSAAEAVEGADLVLTMLADGRVVREVLEVAMPASGALVADMSTSGPEASKAVAEVLKERGVRFLEAPVSGSVGAARKGSLTIMAGGAAGDLADATPVLRQLGERIIHIGPVGTAATLKLCVNALLHTFSGALGEVLGTAERAGIDRETAYDVIENSAIAAPFVRYKRDAFLAGDWPPVAMAVDLVRKDLELFLASVPEPHRDAPTVATAAELVARGQQAGLGSRDMATLARLFRP